MLYVTGGGPLVSVVSIEAHVNPQKPLFMAVCKKCEAKVFVPVPDSKGRQPAESNEAAHSPKRKVPFTCPRCGHEQFTEH